MKAKPSRSKFRKNLFKSFDKKVQEQIAHIRQIGSLGHGTLHQAKVRDLVVPVVKSLTRMPRLETCLDLVQSLNAKYALSPANITPSAWDSIEATKLHSWFLRARRWTLRRYVVNARYTDEIAVDNLSCVNSRCL